MINGLDPIIIFNFNKPVSAGFLNTLKSINLVSQKTDSIPIPPIPLYLSENLTGIYVTTQDKSIQIDTSLSTLSTGETPLIAQKGIQTSVKIGMIANNDSIGMLLLSAFMDQVFPVVTAKGFTITYINGSIIVFNGLLHSFQITQDTESTLMKISLEIIKVGKPGDLLTSTNTVSDTAFSKVGTASPTAAGVVPAGAAIPPPPNGPGPGGGASIPIGIGRL